MATNIRDQDFPDGLNYIVEALFQSKVCLEYVLHIHGYGSDLRKVVGRKRCVMKNLSETRKFVS